MGIRKLFADDDAVSPVVGTTLMVAVTVVLVAVIAMFLLGMGGASQPPQASFGFEFEENVTFKATNTHSNADTLGRGQVSPSDPAYPVGGWYFTDQLTIHHQSGDTISSDNLEIRVKGSEVKYITDDDELQDFGSGFYHSEFTFEDMGIKTDVSAGQSVTITNIYEDYVAHSSGSPYYPGKMLHASTVYVVWDSDGEETSTILTRWNGPDS